jgi:hypothetical protein
MSTVPKLTLIGLYNYTEGQIFQGVTVPEGIQKALFISRLLLTRGEFGVLYPDPEFFQEAARIWSDTWAPEFDRIYETLSEEYDPLHNFNRHEEYTDTEGRERSGSSSATGTSDIETENKVSAFNESTYQPDSMGTSNTTNASSDESTETEDRSLTHTGHFYGNIGLTSNQSMAQWEIDLRLKNRVIDIMCDRFAQELLILTY